jgi:hypothetical protein
MLMINLVIGEHDSVAVSECTKQSLESELRTIQHLSVLISHLLAVDRL